MKILKYLFFLLLIIVIGGAIYFGTQESNYDVSDTKVMNAPAKVVYDKVNNLRSWESWGPWKAEDSTMVFTYPEQTVGEGASYSWTGMMGGSIETTKTDPNKEILMDLTLNTPAGDRFPKVYWNFEETPQGTNVTWGMKGEHTFMDKVYYGLTGNDFDAQMHDMNMKGLNNIDSEVQEDMKRYEVNVIGMTDYGGGYYLYKSASARMSDISMKMGENYGAIMGFMQQANIQQSGMPFTIYNEMDVNQGNVIFTSAIPVKERIAITSGDILCGFMEPTTAVKTVLKGNYTNLGAAYAEAEAYVEKELLLKVPNAKMFEVYANDPGMFPNPADWLTEIYIPVYKDLRNNHPIISGNSN